MDEINYEHGLFRYPLSISFFLDLDFKISKMTPPSMKSMSTCIIFRYRYP